jgi:hypothetical protein
MLTSPYQERLILPTTHFQLPPQINSWSRHRLPNPKRPGLLVLYHIDSLLPLFTHDPFAIRIQTP